MAIDRPGVSELPAPLQLPPDVGPQRSLAAGQAAAYDYMDRVSVEITTDVQGQVAFDEIGKLLERAAVDVCAYLLTGNPRFRDKAELLISGAFDTAVAIRALEGDPGATKLLRAGATLSSTPVQAAISVLGVVLKKVPNPLSAGVGILLTLSNQVASDKLHELEERRAHWRAEQAQRLVPAYRQAKEEQWRLKDALGGRTPQPVYVDRPVEVPVPVVIKYDWHGQVSHVWAPDPLRAVKGQAALTLEQARAAHAQAQTAAAEAAAAPGDAELSAGARAARRAADAARDTWRQAEGELLAAQYDSPALKAGFLAAERARDLAAAAASAPQPAPAPPPPSASSSAPSVAPTAPLPPPSPPQALPPEPARREPPPPAKAQPHDLGPRVPSTPYIPGAGGAATSSLSGLNLLIASSITDDGSWPAAPACTQPHLTPDTVQAICQAFLDGMIARLW